VDAGKLARVNGRPGRLRRLEDSGRDMDDSCTPVVGDGMNARADGTCKSPTDETPEIGGTGPLLRCPPDRILGEYHGVDAGRDVEACKSVPYRRRGCVGELREWGERSSNNKWGSRAYRCKGSRKGTSSGTDH